MYGALSSARKSSLPSDSSSPRGFKLVWFRSPRSLAEGVAEFFASGCKWFIAFLEAQKGTREPNRAHLCFSNVSSSQRLASTANTKNTKKVDFRSTVAIKVPLGSLGSTRHCGDPRHELEPNAVPQQSRHGRARPGTVHTGQIGQPAMQASNIIEPSAA